MKFKWIKIKRMTFILVLFHMFLMSYCQKDNQYFIGGTANARLRQSNHLLDGKLLMFSYYVTPTIYKKIFSSGNIDYFNNCISKNSVFVGLNVSISQSWKNSEVVDWSTTEISPHFLFRYYVLDGLNVEASAGIVYYSERIDPKPFTQSYAPIRALSRFVVAPELSMGYSFKFSDQIFIEPKVSYCFFRREIWRNTDGLRDTYDDNTIRIMLGGYIILKGKRNEN